MTVAGGADWFANASREARIVLRADGTVVAWNPAAARLFRISPARAIGQDWASLLPGAADLLIPPPPPELAGAAPDDSAWARQTLTLADGASIVVDAAVSWHDGNQLLLLADATPLAVTDRATGEVERFYRGMLDALPIGITSATLRDGSFSTLYQNAWGIDVTGWGNEEWERNPDFTEQILHPDDRAPMLAFRDQFRDGFVPFDVEYRVLRPDGTVVWLRDWGTIVYDAAGEPDHTVVCLMDVTAQKSAESALREAVAELSAANAEVKAVSTAKSDYLSFLSHEFRTPLTSIQGFSELLADGDLDPDDMRRFAGIIGTNAQRLNRMITDLLEMDRLESGRRRVRWQPVMLAPLIAEVLATLAGLGHRHLITLEMPPDLPVIAADSDLLTQVLTNVVNNAIKYTPAGGEIAISASQPGPEVIEITVRDSGPGIPPDALETIFHRFVRLAQHEHQPIVGSGLGLPIARQMVELHGGQLWAEHTGAGARFVIQLPIAPEAATSPAEDASAAWAH